MSKVGSCSCRDVTRQLCAHFRVYYTAWGTVIQSTGWMTSLFIFLNLLRSNKRISFFLALCSLSHHLSIVCLSFLFSLFFLLYPPSNQPTFIPRAIIFLKRGTSITWQETNWYCESLKGVLHNNNPGLINENRSTKAGHSYNTSSWLGDTATCALLPSFIYFLTNHRNGWKCARVEENWNIKFFSNPVGKETQISLSAKMLKAPLAFLVKMKSGNSARTELIAEFMRWSTGVATFGLFVYHLDTALVLVTLAYHAPKHKVVRLGANQLARDKMHSRCFLNSQIPREISLPARLTASITPCSNHVWHK